MILLQLRANFGKLHGTLTLHEGLNELCLPNEAGKSTWSAFLLAMLYLFLRSLLSLVFALTAFVLAMLCARENRKAFRL